MKLPRFSYIHVIDKAFAVQMMAAIIKEKYSDDSTLNALLEKTMEVADKIVAGTGNRHLKNLTMGIEEADIYRDNIFRSIFYSLKSTTFNPKYPEKTKAANLLLLKVFGEKLALIALPFGMESARLEEKVDLLIGKYASQVELCGIGELCEDLKIANKQFNSLYSARSGKLDEIPESYRTFNTQINETLRLLCGYIKLTMDEKSASILFDSLNRVTKRNSKNND
jgi:Family of unknown function (DUF6261)